MTRRIFDFEAPDRFVAGAIGDPGERAFFLQASQRGALVTIGVEKVQVAALAGRLAQLLDAVDARFGVGEGELLATRDDLPLGEPLVELFRAAVLALAWDVDARAVLIEAAPEGEADAGAAQSDEGGADLLRVRLDRARARDFVRRASALVAAGRPTCPFCGQLLEPSGHFCPRISLN